MRIGGGCGLAVCGVGVACVPALAVVGAGVTGAVCASGTTLGGGVCGPACSATCVAQAGASSASRAQAPTLRRRFAPAQDIRWLATIFPIGRVAQELA
jgi:hypothetical protein